MQLSTDSLCYRSMLKPCEKTHINLLPRKTSYKMHSSTYSLIVLYLQVRFRTCRADWAAIVPNLWLINSANQPISQSANEPPPHLNLKTQAHRYRCRKSTFFYRRLRYLVPVNPSRTAVLLWGQSSQIISNLSPKRDCGSKRVNPSSLPCAVTGTDTNRCDITLDCDWSSYDILTLYI